MGVIGTCALCKKQESLQNSHLIPKWAYRRVCEADPASPRSPVLVADGSAVSTNKQITRYLLCAECEQRFSTREDYIARLTTLESGRIRLFDNITRMDAPHHNLALLNQEVDAEQIAYFAASVMWRGHVMTGGCKLGAYEPIFREYLLGQAPFPNQAVVSVGLFTESPHIDALGWVSAPASQKTGLLWVHGFLIAGLAFRCLVGKALDQNLHQVSLAGPASQKFAYLFKPEECSDFLAAVEVATKSKPRGRLARN